MAFVTVVVRRGAPFRERVLFHMHGVVANDAEDLREAVSLPAVAHGALKLHAGVRAIGNRLCPEVGAHMAVLTFREAELAGPLALAHGAVGQSAVAGNAADRIIRELAGMDAGVARRRMAPVAAIRGGLLGNGDPVGVRGHHLVANFKVPPSPHRVS
jgi:hypothetical protein